MNTQTMHEEYDRLYAQGSSRLANEGLIGVWYRLPKCFSLLEQHYCNCGPLDILEIGAGVGEAATMLHASKIQVRSYIGTEYSLPAVRHIHKQGFASTQADAERLPFPDNSFDLVFCFDVMHHVQTPQSMAAEMVRVTRRHFFLSESNGLSPVRKVGELSAQARSVGEKSYFPWKYRSFFPTEQIAHIKTYPFYVLVPPKTPPAFIPAVVQLSEFGERLMALRWVLGQSLLIVGEKRQETRR